MRRHARIALVLFTATGAVAARPDDSNALLAQAVDAHTSSLSALMPFEATVEAVVVFPSDAELPPRYTPDKVAKLDIRTKGEFVRSGSQVKITESVGTQRGNTIVRNLDTGKSHLIGARADQQAGAVAPSHAIGSGIDLCDGYLFGLPKPVPPDFLDHVPLDVAVKKAVRATATREPLDGRPSVRIDLTLTPDGSRVAVWLDVNSNYLFKKIVTWRKGEMRSTYEVLAYVEPKPGVFCPSKIERRLVRGPVTTTTLSNLRVGANIPPAAFSTTLPPGSILSDHTTGSISRIGPDGVSGKVVGRIAQRPSTGDAPATSPGHAEATPADAADSWWSLPRAVLLASLLFGLLAAGVHLRNRRGTRAAAP